MDMNNFNLLKNEFANLTNQLKSSLESANSLVLNEVELGSTTLTATDNTNFDFKSNSTASLFENKSDATNTLLNSINNLKKATGCTTSMIQNEKSDQTWVKIRI